MKYVDEDVLPGNRLREQPKSGLRGEVELAMPIIGCLSLGDLLVWTDGLPTEVAWAVFGGLDMCQHELVVIAAGAKVCNRGFFFFVDLTTSCQMLSLQDWELVVIVLLDFDELCQR